MPKRVRRDDRAAGPAADAESVVDVLDVPFDGPYAQDQRVADLPVAPPLSDQCDDLTLSRPEIREEVFRQLFAWAERSVMSPA